MEQGLRILGDGVSIAGLSLVASTSWRAWKAIAPEARVPMQFDRRGEPIRRVGKPLALLFTPVVATIVVFLPTVTGVTFTAQGTQEALMLFVMRALLAGAFAAVHMLHIARVMQVMAAEGQLRS